MERERRMIVRRAYKERLYPNQQQAQTLEWTLTRCRELYNACIQERRDAYRMTGKSLGYCEQKRELPSVKDARPEYKQIGSQVLQDVVKRVDLAFAAFFRRVKDGQTPGYPRFRGKARYDSFTYSQCGWRIKDDRLDLSNIGLIKVRWSRPLQGTVKTVTIRREGSKWFVCFSCMVEIADPTPSQQPATGIDVGLEYFAMLADGSHVENPRYFRKSEEILARRQAALARKKRGSKNRRKALALVRKAHRKIRDQRRYFHHATANTLIAAHGAIAVEDLNTAGMTRRPKAKVDVAKSQEAGRTVYAPNGAAAKSGLNKSINDAGWASFIFILAYKAECAGVRMVKVNPAGTSQLCSGCGRAVPKDLSVRWHVCPYVDCGLSLQRDHNSARVIYQRAGFAGPGGPVLMTPLS